MRVSADLIEELKEDEIFVFGSNESGFHGAGAARIAHDKFGATPYLGFGPSEQTFAIPTKSWEIGELDLSVIETYVERFIAFTKLKSSRGLKFLVTQIGCNLAGFTPEQIAPMFEECIDLKNVYLPQVFIDVIIKNREDVTIKY